MTPIRSLVLLASFAASGGAAFAQGLDCAKAKAPVELAICATPALQAQDRALAAAYAALLARDPAGAAALRTGQRAWLTQRTRTCASKNEPPERVAACLAGLYRARLVALNVAAARPAAAPAASAPAVPPTPAASPGGTAQLLPQPPAPPLPALPTRHPEPEGRLVRTAVPAAGQSDTLVEIAALGRFTIRAESRTGVALQLVDTVAGPGDIAGEAGAKDGRIDAILDRGTYKLRAFGAAGAPGEAKLSLQAVREAGDLSPTLVFGGTAGTDLADGVQRSWWIEVEKPGRVSVEAVGRALADLRLWRNGRDLAAPKPRIDRVTPKTGRPMTRARIDGEVEPGLYLATAYGGVPLAWADGATDLPLHMRTGLPERIAGSLVEGTIGPMGSARFEAPAPASVFRLDLPEPAPATLSARRADGAPAAAAIARNSREPSVTVLQGADGGKPALLEVTGTEGQPFRLRAIDPSASRRIAASGPHWIAAEVVGEGGDEAPATILLAQLESGKPGRVLASRAPQIGPGRAVRLKMNLRGPTTLLFEVAGGATPVAVATSGPKVAAAIDPLLGTTPPRADGRAPRWDLEAGWYQLRLDPAANASGVLDLTFGPPGVTPPAPSAQPARSSIPLGVHNLDRAGSYQLFVNEAPGLAVATVARRLPADLGATAFALHQAAGQALELPVRMPARGFLAVTAADGVQVPVTLGPDTVGPAGRTATIRLPAPERARDVVLSWSDPGLRGKGLAVPPAEDRDAIAAGAPRFFDLGRNAQRSFALDVREGGLYRVETLGRLRTALRLATAILPELDKAEANGPGQNALAQTYLRPGRYRVLVASADSAGRAGLVARPASLPDVAQLRPGTSGRATLADGRGAVFPIRIAEAGRYRLELFSLGEAPRARLEDEEGWPLTVPGATEVVERDFQPGRYRLVVLPRVVEARVVARLESVLPRPELAGHGPHPLAFDAERAFQWREPAAAGEERVPDRWTFALAGPSDVTLALTEGMAGDLLREGAGERVARIVGKSGFSGRLPPGRYTLEARAQGRNDRLDYRVSTGSKEIQPGTPRRVALPATIPFALAEDRVVNLTTFGRTDLRGVLKDASGRVVERLDDRADDWNIGLSRRLPAGAYTLDLAALDPGPAPKPAEDAAVGEGEESPDADAEVASDGAAEGEAAQAGADAAEAASPDGRDAERDDRIEIRLALPADADHPPLAGTGEGSFEGAAVHRFPLPDAPIGNLLLVAASAESELALSVERRDDAGRWTGVATERGKAPLVAVPGDGKGLRAAVWSVDGGPARIDVAARSLHREPGGTGALEPETVTLGAVAEARVDLVVAPEAGVLRLDLAPDGLLQGSLPGEALTPAGRTIVAQTDTVWLVSRGGQAPAWRVEPAPIPTDEIALTVPAGGRAAWPRSAPPSGHVRLWRATSTFGQPALTAGRGMGIAAGSAAALAGHEALKAWNAGDGGEALALRLVARDLKLAEEVRTATGHAGLVPAGGAVPVRLPAGPKSLALDLPAGTAAIADWAGKDAVTAWTGEAAVSRRLDGAWTSVLLVNLTGEPTPVRIAITPLAEAPAPLAAGAVTKRFVGAAGSLRLAVAGEPGDRLVTVGAEAGFAGADGRVLRGPSLALSGPGEVVLDHGPGLVAAWIERPGLSPWPAVELRPTELPARIPLDGPAMALALKAGSSLLLTARTTAPVILTLARAGEEAVPVAFPAGAELHRLLPGDAVLRIDSPHDGPLAGTLELSASPIRPAGEGIGEPVALAPGGGALFGFEVAKAGQVGLGIRAEPDAVAVRLLDAAGRSLGSGPAQFHRLEPGRYLIEASIPVDGRTSTVRPAILGLEPPPSGPPPDVVRSYLQMVGLAPTRPAR